MFKKKDGMVILQNTLYWKIYYITPLLRIPSGYIYCLTASVSEFQLSQWDEKNHLPGFRMLHFYPTSCITHTSMPLPLLTSTLESILGT